MYKRNKLQHLWKPCCVMKPKDTKRQNTIPDRTGLFEVFFFLWVFLKA